MKKIRLGIIGNSSQVRDYYLRHLCKPAKLPCPVEIAWVSGCTCTPKECKSCPFRDPNVPAGLALSFDASKSKPCVRRGNLGTWRRHVSDHSVDAVLVSSPNHFHLEPAGAFLERGVPVAVDKPPVVHASDARRLVKLAQNRTVPFATLAQRRFEAVYRLMAKKIRNREMGKIQLINLLFVHGWPPNGWRRKKSLAGGGVLIDATFNCLDVLLWLLRQSKPCPSATHVHAQWALQDPSDPDTVELRATVGVKFDTGCLLNITASCTSVGKESVDEDLKIFGSKGILRYRREKMSRKSMASGELSFQSIRNPKKNTVLSSAGQSQGLREAPFDDFLCSVHDRRRRLKSPAEDSIAVLEIIEKAYLSAKKNGILIPLK